MLIIDRTQRTWATLSAVVCLVAGAAYIWYSASSPDGPSGGSVPGLIFGLISSGMMVFAGLLSVRRRFPIARWGSGQFWLRAHLWVGALTVPFALFHAGFGLGGRLEMLLWLLFVTVIASGFWGLILQQYLPRMMLEQIPRETFIEQIPHLCHRFTVDSDRLLSELCGPLEISLTAIELKHYESHLRRHFEEDRSKNRSQYPKTASDAEHFQTFLAKVYVAASATSDQSIDGRRSSAADTAGPASGAPTEATPADATPTLQSVARVTHPPADTAVTASPAPPPAKPDPRALLAAAKARTAALDASAGTSTAAVPASSALGESAPAPMPEGRPTVADAAAKPKPDPQALLAAARAKRAALTAASPSAESPPPTIPPTEVHPSAETHGNPETPPPAAPTEKPKPDPQALLAAARARKAALEAAATLPPTELPASPATPTTPAQPQSAPASTAGKPSPQAMLAEIKAKREAAARAAAGPATGTAATSEPTAVTQASASKPDPLARLRAARDVAPPQSGSLGTALTAAAEVAPPTPEQLAEMKLFYIKLIRPQLPAQRDTRDWMEAIRQSTMACSIRKDNQHPQFIKIFEQLREMCEQRRQFAFVLRYHRWLHGWLLIHIPATVALYLILVVHAVAALRVIPFGN